MRPITTDAEDGAARIFAERIARREYGPRGYVRTMRADHWTRDGSTVTYSAFIGRSPRDKPHETVGRDETFTVHRAIAVTSRRAG